MSTLRPTAASRKPFRLLGVLAIPSLLLLGSSLPGAAQDEQPATRSLSRGMNSDLVKGVTKPSKEMDLAFALLGQVSEVLVKEGERVEQGQVLMKQDSRADMARLQGLEAKADVQVLIDLAEAQRDLAQVELEVARRGGVAVPELEVRRAEVELELGETRIKEQERQGLIEGSSLQEQRILIEYKQLTSPESGIVQTIDAAVGEVFGPQTPAIRVVKIDPLQIEVIQAPASRVMPLRVGDSIPVRYEGEDDWHEAQITYIDPVGNASGSPSRLRFKAEMANPDARPAGLAVEVRLPTPARTADASAN